MQQRQLILSGFHPGATAPSPTTADVHQALAQLRERGTGWRPLEGKILALISASEDTEEAQRFRQAATALGARVAWMRPGFSDDSNAELIRSTSRVLGKLYDAIECQGPDAAVLALMREVAGIPVFDHLAGAVAPDDPLALQARLLHALI